MVYPLPAVMVSCGASPEEYNIMTAAWVGTICSEPPMCYVSIRPERHSYEIIKRTGEFVINLTTEALAEATDWCGVRSGRHFDKFSACSLTPEPSAVVKAPAILESPISVECRVKEIVPLGSHDMFLAKVLAVDVDEALLDAKGVLHLERAGLAAYVHGRYRALGRELGKFGFSVQKKQEAKR